MSRNRKVKCVGESVTMKLKYYYNHNNNDDEDNCWQRRKKQYILR